MEINKTIGRNIKLYRDINGFSQIIVANYLGITREMISYYENGLREIPLDVLDKLSDLYGVDLEDFYEEDERIVNENVTCAFRTDGFESQDLEAIAGFKAIVKNYLKMNKLLTII